MRRLMVVDDEEIIRDIVQDIVDISCNNIIVDTACTCEEALGKLQQEDYDLVFLDMKLKSDDGLETFRRMRDMMKTFSGGRLGGLKSLFSSGLNMDALSSAMAGGRKIKQRSKRKRKIIRRGKIRRR